MKKKLSIILLVIVLAVIGIYGFYALNETHPSNRTNIEVNDGFFLYG